jgi:hypothetical protein
MADATGHSTIRNQLGIKERKLRACLGAVAGYVESTQLLFESGNVHGRYVDWPSWSRYMLPEFCLVLNSGKDQPVGVVITDTGEFIAFDTQGCHPSDASLLLSGANDIRIASLIEALRSEINQALDGERLTSAHATLARLTRIIGSGT